MYSIKNTILSIVLCISLSNAYLPCSPRTYENGTVCVCNTTYCDTAPEVHNNLENNQYQIITTSKDGPGFFSVVKTFGQNSTSEYKVNLTYELQQYIYGFGGGVTGTAAYNIVKLNDALQEFLLESYYGETGIQYTFNRVPMGCTDFSLSHYSNLEEKDETLESWTLRAEDDYKIQVLKRANELRGQDNLKNFVSSWSSPLWMKTEENYFGTGVLKEEYYDLWAQYYIKFFEAYKKHGVEFWGMTTQNEQFSSPYWNINLKWTHETMNNWIVKSLGPTIRKSEFMNLKILFFDDVTSEMEGFRKSILNNETVLKYMDGVATHWYTDYLNQPEWFKFPLGTILLATEACQDVSQYLAINEVSLGNWDRGVNYINSILDDLELGFNGWVEWNLALDLQGGPSWIGASLDAPIIVNATGKEFYKEPMFYVVGQFSKYVAPGSFKLELEINQEAKEAGIRSAAFLRPDNHIALILSNSNDKDVEVVIGIHRGTFSIPLAANSLNTVLFNSDVYVKNESIVRE